MSGLKKRKRIGTPSIVRFGLVRILNDDAACFFAQQCVEKYLKARLVEADIFFKKTHDLTYLLELVKPVEPLWVAYEQELRVLTDYAIEFRYPGATADLKIAKLAQKLCSSFLAAARQSLGLKP